ncbi:MAG: 50S ribosomal protein L35 [Rickettsiales bacterium]|jgi:large subunit ribosomal protein L35|nr:50S ribosomal protein L35 [Rickettsiales bacterium]
MNKLKTNSGCKKRFKMTGSGKLKIKNSNKRHCMARHSNRQIRRNRRPDYMFKGDLRYVLKSLLPNGL